MLDLKTCQALFAEHRDRFIEDWKTYLRFPSISADPSHHPDCLACAQWLMDQLSTMGFTTSLIETPGLPMVYAHREAKPGHPTILYYGHYDVQPVDPLEDWTTPPFEPTLRGDRLYARGAQDNKGQTAYVLKALETLIAQDALNCGVKMLIEGEEETGSKGINAVLNDLGDRVQSDVLMVCDTGAVAADVPTITMGLRGIYHLTLHLDGPSHDLHSGMHGGIVKNPATELARLLATLHDETGKIAVEGYYDGVDVIGDQDRALANASPIDPDSYQAHIGIAPKGGEHDVFTPVERASFRPTIEVNGFHAGYGGPGSKTIIPATAMAKISSRLVGDQDPQRALDCLVKHLQQHVPEDLDLRIEEVSIGGPALMLSAEAPLVKQAREALEPLSDKATALTWGGGSIPIVSGLAKVAHAQPLLVGFGLDEDCIHAPNESFSLKQFEDGFLYATRMLSSF